MAENYRRQDNLGETGQDLLGFTDIAGRLADVLIDPAVAGGIVLGLEGTWGSGKSHLVGLTKRELSKRQGAVFFDFRPWLVGNRDELLDAFFADLRSVIKLHCDKGASDQEIEVDNVLKKLLGYSARFGRLAPLVKLAGLVGLPGAPQLEDFVQQLAKVGELGKGAEPLSVMKDEISTALAKFSTRIIVFIDDVDRLEPSEIVEVLRLVRSVADFPNLVYVLCYDAAVVAEAITCETKAGDGRAYLAKIVQIPVQVPESEPFALRRMLASGLAEIWDGRDPSSADRLLMQLDYSTHRLRTPRDVNRVLDSVRFLWPALRGRADFVDLCGLQLIKNSNPALYQSIEALCAYFAEDQIGSNRSSGERGKQILEDMRKALRAEGFSLAEIPRDVVALAPKFAIKSSTDSSMGVELDALSFSMKEKDLASAEAGKRLASPYHYRLYFALSAPKGAPQNDDFTALRYALRTEGEEVSNLLQGWFDGPTFFDGTTKGREVLKRIERQPFESLGYDEAGVFVAALADVMDQCAETKWTMHGKPDDWYYAGKILHHLSISDYGFGLRSEIDSAFKDGKSISWLAYILRWDLLVDARSDTSEYLPSGVLQTACEAFKSRLDGMTWQEVFETKRPLLLLDCWRLLGYGDEARALFNEGAESDDDFVSLLEAMVEVVDHPNNRSRVKAVPHSALTVVIDPEAAKNRLDLIMKDSKLLMNRSKSLLKSIHLGADMVEW